MNSLLHLCRIAQHRRRVRVHVVHVPRISVKLVQLVVAVPVHVAAPSLPPTSTTCSSRSDRSSALRTASALARWADESWMGGGKPGPALAAVLGVEDDAPLGDETDELRATLADLITCLADTDARRLPVGLLPAGQVVTTKSTLAARVASSASTMASTSAPPGPTSAQFEEGDRDARRRVERARRLLAPRSPRPTSSAPSWPHRAASPTALRPPRPRPRRRSDQQQRVRA